MTPFTPDEWQQIDALVRLAFKEDIGPGDVTTAALFPDPIVKTVHILLNSTGVVAGLPVAGRVLSLLDSSISVTWNAADGDHCPEKSVIGVITGDLRRLLEGERILLNFLGRLSGIATITAATVKQLSGSKAILLDTRKTTPGWRALEKYAVRLGGGYNHRRGLYDMILVKDTHIDASTSFIDAVRRAVEYRNSRYPDMKVEIEVSSVEQIRETLAEDVDIIMLDNMSDEETEEAVRIVQNTFRTEASGNISPDRLSTLARAGVDAVSMGALTHKAVSLDVSMKIVAG